MSKAHFARIWKRKLVVCSETDRFTVPREQRVRCINVTAGSICTIMVNGNDWEERKMGRATEQEQDQQRAVRGVANFCSLASSSSFFFCSSSFLWTRISEYPHGRALVKVFLGGEGGFSLFKKKGSVGHSLPSVTLVSSLVVVLF